MPSFFWFLEKEVPKKSVIPACRSLMAVLRINTYAVMFGFETIDFAIIYTENHITHQIFPYFQNICIYYLPNNDNVLSLLQKIFFVLDVHADL